MGEDGPYYNKADATARAQSYRAKGYKATVRKSAPVKLGGESYNRYWVKYAKKR